MPLAVVAPVGQSPSDFPVTNPRQLSDHRVHWTKRGFLSYKYSIRCWNCNLAYHATFRWRLSSRISRCPHCKQPPRRLRRDWWRACFLLPPLAPFCAWRNAPYSPRALLEAIEAGYLGSIIYGVLIGSVACAHIVESDYQAQELAREQATARMMHDRDKAVTVRTAEEQRKIREWMARTGKSESELRAYMARFGVTHQQAREYLDGQK